MNRFQELLAIYGAAVKNVEFWRSNGTWGDGMLAAAKGERKRAKRALNFYVAAMLEGAK